MAESRKGSVMSDRPSVTGSNRMARKGSVAEKPIDLDDLLINELGQFGRFQVRMIMLISVPMIMSAFMSEYIFSAAAIPHRCERFESSQIGNGSLDYCPAYLFEQSRTLECESFVYEKDNSVVYDFNLGCKDNLRVLAGTLNSVGTLLVLPIIGFISDRWGRRLALTLSVFNLALVGLIRAFSVNYPMYLVLQLLQTTVGAGTYSSAYIFATELVGPKYRVVTSATCASMFAIGQVVLGLVAWLVQPWRYMIMTLHIPCFLIISYYWLLSESVRWLLSKKKYDEAKEVLEKVARVNKKQISEKSMHSLMNPPPPPPVTEGNDYGLIKTIIKSRVLLRRVCTTPIWWITTTFVYYGLSINSTALVGTNMYLNFILTCAIEIPGFFTAVLILDRVGRKITLSSGFFLSAAFNIAFVFVSSDLTTVRLVLFLLGKFGISIVFTSLYLFTSELYPTQYRHTLLAFSSMIGRLGSITAPLTPLLADNYWHGIPNLMFGGMGLISGCLVLTQPETLGTKMPDTLEEAEAIGKPKSKRQTST
ncbi:organic cation transporter protein-like isoform X2 [Galleria mellonella]|uniref:Organic cation transporter protein-like isoform X2 n=1 Tax=Galleria mellonella TaxID=7137 RepID=A0ABM3MFQ3_GALME|nr:organic cation transporter protein-like isoform X2 [Galleria mellonella]